MTDTGLPDQLPRTQCLQCGADRYTVARTKQACTVVSDPGEPEMSWQDHHFTDWTDKELKQFKVESSQLYFNRRTSSVDLERASLIAQGFLS